MCFVFPRLVARTLADVHSIDLRNLQLKDKMGRPASLEKGVRYIPALIQYLSGAPDTLDVPEMQQRSISINMKIAHDDVIKWKLFPHY